MAEKKKRGVKSKFTEKTVLFIKSVPPSALSEVKIAVENVLTKYRCNQ